LFSPVLPTFGFSLLRSQSQDERKQGIQQLKDKLQELDQMMNEVKEELRALEGTQGPPIAPAVGQSQAETQETPAQQGPLVAVPSEAVISKPQAGTVPMEGEITERQNTVNF
jgi:hypothetical protein